MNTKDIPKGFWLNVTVMARYQTQFIVGVLRQGKASWITEGVKGHFNHPDDAYDWGLDWIERYQAKKLDEVSKIEPEPVLNHCGDCNGTGVIVNIKVVPRCCGFTTDSEGCCNYPEPHQIQVQEQCGKCCPSVPAKLITRGGLGKI